MNSKKKVNSSKRSAAPLKRGPKPWRADLQACVDELRATNASVYQSFLEAPGVSYARASKAEIEEHSRASEKLFERSIPKSLLVASPLLIKKSTLEAFKALLGASGLTNRSYPKVAVWRHEGLGYSVALSGDAKLLNKNFSVIERAANTLKRSGHSFWTSFVPAAEILDGCEPGGFELIAASHLFRFDVSADSESEPRPNARYYLNPPGQWFSTTSLPSADDLESTYATARQYSFGHAMLSDSTPRMFKSDPLPPLKDSWEWLWSDSPGSGMADSVANFLEVILGRHRKRPKSGMTLREIANVTGFSLATVYRKIESLEVPTSDSPRRIDQSYLEAIKGSRIRNRLGRQRNKK